ncbi:MAG: polyprenyl synthetase family protein [Candidatus Electryonea clarkiae]|nr:polyprenyl synthetase family protein [Candidatus Electryonea clarkiae]MDP8285241.1 polyprenyl synthetase family protein [Candidatus Electryonea clarkiae]
MAGSFQDSFLNELDLCVARLERFLSTEKYTKRFHPSDLLKAVTLYMNSGGKRLRPAILLWSCGVVGGNDDDALPAAAAVELFHTWSLVHDDIIDRDDQRRGNDTVHECFRREALKKYGGISPEDAAHYGISVAVLSGDVQHGWAISMLTELSREGKLDPVVTLNLINDIDTEVLNYLVEGEILDMQFAHMDIEQLNVDTIEDMLWKKTGVLYRYCARTGALIGLGHGDRSHPYVRALEAFSKYCGLAFQLQDDILGIVGDSDVLGKPVGSDIIEGKRTTVIYYAYMGADTTEREKIMNVLGRNDASESDIREVVDIIIRRGGIEMTRQRAKNYLEQAYPELEKLPHNKYHDLLKSWADFMITREW